MSLPSLTSGTSLDTSIHYHGLEGYDHSESHEPPNLDHGETPNLNDNGDDPTYPCLFGILNCHQTFTNPEYWKTHVLSHFRTFEPPAIARCPFCSSSSGSGSGSGPGPGSEPTSSPVSSPRSQLDGSIGSSASTDESIESSTDRVVEDRTTTFINTPHTRAWDALLDHLVSHYQQQHQLQLQLHHQQSQQSDSQSHSQDQSPSHNHSSNSDNHPHIKQRTDFELLRYLYTLRLITEDQWKAAVQLGVVPGSPTDRRGEQSVRQRVGRADEPFWGLFSPRRERRRQRHSPGRNTAGGRGSGHSPGRGPRGPRRPGRIVLSSC